ncbi:MAG: hypothetical protein ACRDRT_03915 [Pseudonocardiaceae bacterium]
MTRKFAGIGRPGKLLACIAIAALGGTGGAVALGNIATAAPGLGNPVPTVPKSQAPANINPSKQPVTDPTKIERVPTVPLTPAQQQTQAAAWKAQDPNARVVCTRPDGSIAGAAELDRVDPSSPLNPAAAAAVCDRGYPGTHP